MVVPGQQHRAACAGQVGARIAAHAAPQFLCAVPIKKRRVDLRGADYDFAELLALGGHVGAVHVDHLVAVRTRGVVPVDIGGLLVKIGGLLQKGDVQYVAKGL